MVEKRAAVLCCSFLNSGEKVLKYLLTKLNVRIRECIPFEGKIIRKPVDQEALC